MWWRRNKPRINILSRKEVVKVLVGSLLFVTAGVYMFLNAEDLAEYPGLRLNGLLEIRIVSISCILFFGLGIIWGNPAINQKVRIIKMLRVSRQAARQVIRSGRFKRYINMVQFFFSRKITMFVTEAYYLFSTLS